MDKVSIAGENSELENPKVAVLGMELLQILEESVRKLNGETIPNIYENFFNSDDSIKAIYGIKGDLKDWPKWKYYKLPNITKPKI